MNFIGIIAKIAKKSRAQCQSESMAYELSDWETFLRFFPASLIRLRRRMALRGGHGFLLVKSGKLVPVILLRLKQSLRRF